MKRSIKARITAYYAIMMLVLVGVACLFVFLSSWLSIKRTGEATLREVVVDSLDSISEDAGIVEIKGDFETYDDGVVLLVYGGNGVRIKGAVPKNFPESTPLKRGTIQRVEVGITDWIVFDANKTLDDGTKIWIRGIYNMDNRLEANARFLVILMTGLPIIMVFSVIAGYIITRRAFRPVVEMTTKASEIEGGDLSERLPVARKKDELYKLATTLNSMLDRLERAFINEKQFAGDASHELKTPVAVIMTECEYALKESGTVDEYRDSLETIQAQCVRMMSLISQLMQISQTQNIQDLLSKEEFDLSMLCDSVVEELTGVAAADDVELRADIEKNILYNGDEAMMMRLLMNLITNGIKYRNDDVDSFVQLSLKRDESSDIVIEVSDNGVGIDEKIQGKIFNRLYKGDSSRTRKNESEADQNSFGLGLSFVKWIAEGHGGSVSLESTPGQGSKFTVKL